MLDIREVITRPEYKWLDEYKDRLCFLTFGGSHAYGTNLPTSDIDIRGVMLPTKETLLGLHNEEQRMDAETDSCIYEFNKFVKLISNCNPNTIELLGSRPETVLIFNDVGLELYNNVSMFLTKKCIHSFGGYATAQLRRLENALCHDEYPAEEKEKHIYATLQTLLDRLYAQDPSYQKKLQIKLIEGEICASVNVKNYPLRQLTTNLNELNTVARQFDKLNTRNSKKDETHLNKHAMHLCRLYLMAFDILEKGEVNTYRGSDLDFLMALRKGEVSLLDKGSDLWIKLSKFEKRLEMCKTSTKLPKDINFKEVQDFVINVNERVVNKDVNKIIKKPLLLTRLQSNTKIV